MQNTNMLTTFEYQEAIRNYSESRKRILTTLYEIEPVVDSCIIAENLGYKGYQAANLHIGSIGKSISDHQQRKPKIVYEHKGKDTYGYFSLVHNHDGEKWVMVKELKQAIKNLGWV